MAATRFGAPALVAFTLLAPVLGWVSPPERAKVSGRHTMTVTLQQQGSVGDAPGHVLLLMEAKGTNGNTGSTPWMEGATLSSSGTADLIAGNGPQQGYIVEVEHGDTMYVRWNGRVTTTLADGKNPVTSFEGQWTKTGGSGRFSGVTGAGTYHGRFTSQTTYTTDWTGEVDLPKGYSAAQ